MNFLNIYDIILVGDKYISFYINKWWYFFYYRFSYVTFYFWK